MRFSTVWDGGVVDGGGLACLTRVTCDFLFLPFPCLASFFVDFFMWIICKVFVEFVTILLLPYVWFLWLACGILALDQRLNLHPLHWKAKS